MAEKFDKLVELAKILRSPDGCPWDREQNHRSVLNDLLEECYEFFDSVDKNDAHEMKEELGDLLWQVIFHCQIASEENAFSADDVLQEISEKLIRRHPHVFKKNGDEETNSETLTGGKHKEILKTWEKIKRDEKGKEGRKSVLDGIPKTLPSLYLAEKIQKKTARFGFDWDNVLEPLEKIEEEIREFREAAQNGKSDEKTLEFGDILFALVNVARHFDVSAEDALRASVAKFGRRFNYIENHFNYDGEKLRNAGLKKLDELWNEAKIADGADKTEVKKTAKIADEGYIKYNAVHKEITHKEMGKEIFGGYGAILAMQKRYFDDLLEVRNRLFSLGLVGVYQNGIGFGNCSVRYPERVKYESENKFVITGSNTGAREKLVLEHLCLVESFDIEKNTVFSKGPIQASSEAMTHGAVYSASGQINCVLHIHSRKLFDYLAKQIREQKEDLTKIRHTAENIPYGTPQMAVAVMKETEKTCEYQPRGIIVTLGHDEGILAFGESIEAAMGEIEGILKECGMLKCEIIWGLT